MTRPRSAYSRMTSGYEFSPQGRTDFREPLNQLDYADDPAEFELQKELRRLGVQNSQQPTVCPDCKGELTATGGMVGETVLACSTHGIVWEDSEDAIRRVY